MARSFAMTELQNMPLNDLLHEMKEVSSAILRLKMGVRLRKEKDTAKLRRERRRLARILTVVTQKQGSALKASSRPSTVPASR